MNDELEQLGFSDDLVFSVSWVDDKYNSVSSSIVAWPDGP